MIVLINTNQRGDGVADYSVLEAWIGKTVLIEHAGGDDFEGRLTGADDGGLAFELVRSRSAASDEAEWQESSGGTHVYFPWFQVRMVVSVEEGEGGGATVSLFEGRRSAR